ncbi:MAG: sigma-70 family RNA polymerase sigma factor [Akkermansiaceae bacterium]|nr:sigma-70 family RNA polymerase sigma factor [Armatimonadota bacterium]
MYSEVIRISSSNEGDLCGSLTSRGWCGSDDAALVRQCGQGDTDALKELALRYESPLFRFLRHQMNSVEDAEEAVLEVFVRVWLHAARFRFQASVSTWLYRIAANIARDAYDRRKVRPQTVPSDTCESARLAIGDAAMEAQARLESADRSRVLQQALAALDSNDRLVLVLYYLEERDYKEMQVITGWIYPVLKTRLVRARVRLRARMKELGFEAIL